MSRLVLLVSKVDLWLRFRNARSTVSVYGCFIAWLQPMLVQYQLYSVLAYHAINTIFFISI